MHGIHPWSRADEADAERKEIPDPHHAEEIAMLQRSMSDPRLSVAGVDNTRGRVEYLRSIAPFFDGRRMVKDTAFWPCQCALCVERE